MRKILVTAAILLAACAALAAKPEPDPVREEIETTIGEAAQAEKKEDCETAYIKYREAEGRLSGVNNKGKAAELESILTNKIDKVLECYEACQPTERQKAVLVAAKEHFASGQPRRAIQMVKRMLVGKNEKCRFWASARAYLRTLPAQAEEEDKYDPCDVSPATRQAMQEAREAAARQKAEVEKYEALKGKLQSKLPDLITLFRDIDGTRLQVFRFREEFLDCDEAYNPLVEDAAVLKESLGKAQEMVITTYKGQVASLSNKVRQAQAKLKEREKMLEVQGQELDKLKKQFDELSAFNEEIFNDLFNLVGMESVKLTTTVEGQKIEQTLPDIQAILASEAKVIQVMQERYPEYFKDGINVEGLKRRKFVMEKLQQMMQKFAKKQGGALGYDKAMTELDSTIKLMDSAIEKGSRTPEGLPKKALYGIIAGAAVVIAILAATLVITARRRKTQF
jgi:myosin heavy subunit